MKLLAKVMSKGVKSIKRASSIQGRFVIKLFLNTYKISSSSSSPSKRVFFGFFMCEFSIVFMAFC